MSTRQWRNVISGDPRFKIFEDPASISAKGTSRPPVYARVFLGAPGHAHPENF
jgi:hypothetical protein